MRYEYIFKITDDEARHGFSIEVPKTDLIDPLTIIAFGDYSEMNNIRTPIELKDYLLNHWDEIEEVFDKVYPDAKHHYANEELFEELIDFIDNTLVHNANN